MGDRSSVLYKGKDASGNTSTFPHHAQTRSGLMLFYL